MTDDNAAVENRILDAAARVFGSRVYHKASVQEIADRAGVGKGSIYRRFKDKNALLIASARIMMEQLARELLAGMDIDRPEDSVEKLVQTYIRFFRENPHFPELVIQVRAAIVTSGDKPDDLYVVEAEDEIIQLVEEAQAQGVIRDLPPGDVIYAVRSILYGAVFFQGFSGRDPGSPTLAATLVETISHGILEAKHRN